MKPIIFVNEKFKNNISVLDHGLLYGDGVFTTFRIFNGKCFCMNYSINRFFDSAKKLSIKVPCSAYSLRKLIKRAYLKSKLIDAYVRIVLTRGVGDQGINFKCKPNLIIIVSYRKFEPLKKIKLDIFKERKTSKLLYDSNLKSLNYFDFTFAKLNAIKKGFDDAVLLNEKGNVAEASTSNIFIVKENKIYTPSKKSGILEGSIRKKILDNFDVIEKEISIKELLSAEEVFLSGTVNFITSIESINNHHFKKFDSAENIFNKLKEFIEKSEIL